MPSSTHWTIFKANKSSFSSDTWNDIKIFKLFLYLPYFCNLPKSLIPLFLYVLWGQRKLLGGFICIGTRQVKLNSSNISNMSASKQAHIIHHYTITYQISIFRIRIIGIYPMIGIHGYTLPKTNSSMCKIHHLWHEWFNLPTILG